MPGVSEVLVFSDAKMSDSMYILKSLQFNLISVDIFYLSIN